MSGDARENRNQRKESEKDRREWKENTREKWEEFKKKRQSKRKPIKTEKKSIRKTTPLPATRPRKKKTDVGKKKNNVHIIIYYPVLQMKRLKIICAALNDFYKYFYWPAFFMVFA
jgi:hypothetical protein